MNVTPTSSVARKMLDRTTASGTPQSLDYDAFLTAAHRTVEEPGPHQADGPQPIHRAARSFSGVEQAIKTNNKLDTMMTSLALSQAEGFIGRTVASAMARCRAR